MSANRSSFRSWGSQEGAEGQMPPAGRLPPRTGGPAHDPSAITITRAQPRRPHRAGELRIGAAGAVAPSGGLLLTCYIALRVGRRHRSPSPWPRPGGPDAMPGPLAVLLLLTLFPTAISLLGASDSGQRRVAFAPAAREIAPPPA